MIAAVGTAGATTVVGAVSAGGSVIAVGSAMGFSAGETITIDGGGNSEMAVVVSANGGRGGSRITVAGPLKFAHAAGAQLSGSGITLRSALTKAHGVGSAVGSEVPTPGGPNRY